MTLVSSHDNLDNQRFFHPVNSWPIEVDQLLHTTEYSPPSLVAVNETSHQPLPSEYNVYHGEQDTQNNGTHLINSIFDTEPGSFASLDNAFDIRDASDFNYFPPTSQSLDHRLRSVSDVAAYAVAEQSPSIESSNLSEPSTPDPLWISETEARSLHFRCSVCKKLFKRLCDLKYAVSVSCFLC